METPLKRLIDAAYGGWERPSDDPGILNAIADWMDRLDNVADGLGPTKPVGREMQDDLRRIAARIRDSESAISRRIGDPPEGP